MKLYPAEWFNQAHRRIYGEKTIEFALLTIGGLVFAQVLSEERISGELLFLGLALVVAGAMVSYQFLAGVKDNKGGA